VSRSLHRRDIGGKFRLTERMTKEQVKTILERVLTWPTERQEDVARIVLSIDGAG
jgi:hypothetical protein